LLVEWFCLEHFSGTNTLLSGEIFDSSFSGAGLLGVSRPPRPQQEMGLDGQRHPSIGVSGWP